MKLSNETVEVLKNFSTINQNLVIKSGKGKDCQNIYTMSALKNIMASAVVSDVFPVDLAIYDLNEFLAVLSCYEDPELEFSEKFVMIYGEDGAEFKYWFSDESVVSTPKKLITMPSVEISFKFKTSILSHVQKTAAVIGAPDMALRSKNATSGLIEVTDRKNDNAHNFAVPIDVKIKSGEDIKYAFWFKVENLKLLTGTYDVDVSSKKISYFKNDSFPMEYFIALEPASSYNE